MAGSLAQLGINPQRGQTSSRVGSLWPGTSRTTATGCDGAMLNRGANGGNSKIAKCSATTLVEARKVKRPHISPIVPCDGKRQEQADSRCRKSFYTGAQPEPIPLRWRVGWLRRLAKTGFEHLNCRSHVQPIGYNWK